MPGATSWVDVMTFGAKLPWHHSNRNWVTVTEIESLSTEQLFLEIKFCENSIFTGELVVDALENKKIVLKEH